MCKIIKYKPASFFCKSCLVFCETSLMVKFLRTASKNAKNGAILVLNFVCFDVWGGDVL